jgi:hypothetical protein
VVVPPGERVRVQVPVAGKPDKTTLPVETEQVGCVMVPGTGAAGVEACVLIATLAEACDTHPDALVTVKV